MGPYMDIYGPYMAIYGPYMAIYGPYMAICGPYMGIYGPSRASGQDGNGYHKFLHITTIGTTISRAEMQKA